MEMTDIRGKVAVITGAGRGIGKGIAIVFGRAGAKVVIASRTRVTVETVVSEIEGEGGIALGIPCNVAERDEVFAMVDRAADAFGTVDILVNNAQSYAHPDSLRTHDGRQPLETYDARDWEYCYRTGVLATLWGMQAAFPYMRDHGGKIINMASLSGQIGIDGFAAYNVAKEGIRALSRTAAREWGRHRINVNVIVPAVKSDSLVELERNQPEFLAGMLKQIPLGRWGDPVEDAGPLALFLASRASDYITGMTMMLDGGQFISP
jgi:2-hydroxycyclohexanecarboxyl-CoA dehydrogenase